MVKRSYLLIDPVVLPEDNFASAHHVTAHRLLSDAPSWRYTVNSMVDLKELLEYNEEVRHRYFDVLAKLPWNELIQNREASFHSLRNIFIHSLNGTDYWLDFLLGEQLYVRRKFDEYSSVEDIKRYMEQVEARMRKYLQSLTPEKLAKKYGRKNDAGEDVEITTEDVLIHVFEEEVHHRGELIALLWQIGVDPPLMGWKLL